MEIFKQFTFDSAHYLPNVSETHKCRRMHGHTYILTVFISGNVGDASGWVMDFNDIKAVMEPVLDEVDHRVLNDISGLENPTCEVFTVWLWNRIKKEIPGLSKIELKETPTSGAVYRG